MSKKVFEINLELVHLAMETACASAMAREVERQFHEQYPDQFLHLEFPTASFPHFDNVDLDLHDKNYEVKIVGGKAESFNGRKLNGE